MHLTDLPLAAFQIQELLPIVLMVLYAVAHLVGAKQQMQKRRLSPPPRPAAPPPAAQPGQPPAIAGPGGAKQPQPTLEETLRREVEEFLRRSQGQQKPAAPPSAKQPPPARQRPPSPQQRGNGNRQTAGGPLRGDRAAPGPGPTRQAEAPAKENAIPRLITEAPREQVTGSALGASVAQHVAQAMGGAQSIVQHAEHLGDRVALADEKMEEHLREKFVHRLGSLEQQAAGPERKKVSSPMAEELFQSLAKPGGIRQLVVAAEILRRPEDRW